MPKLDFDMISNQAKEDLAKLMLESGNIESPLYTLCSERLPNDSEEDENEEEVFPDWIQIHVFKETNENEIKFRVIFIFKLVYIRLCK